MVSISFATSIEESTQIFNRCWNGILCLRLDLSRMECTVGWVGWFVERGYLIIELFSKYQKIIKRKYPGFEEKVVWICERNVDRIGVGDCVVIDGSIGKIIRLSEIDGIVEIGGKEKLVYLSEIGLGERLLKIWKRMNL